MLKRSLIDITVFVQHIVCRRRFQHIAGSVTFFKRIDILREVKPWIADHFYKFTRNFRLYNPPKIIKYVMWKYYGLYM